MGFVYDLGVLFAASGRKLALCTPRMKVLWKNSPDIPEVFPTGYFKGISSPRGLDLYKESIVPTSSGHAARLTPVDDPELGRCCLVELINAETTERLACNSSALAFRQVFCAGMKIELAELDSAVSALRSDPSPSGAGKAAAVCSDSLTRLYSLIFNYEYTTERYAGNVSTKLTCLSSEIHQSLSWITPQFIRNGADVSISISEGIWAEVNAEILELMLLDLMSNAYMHNNANHKRIAVGLISVGDRAELSVTDNGTSFDLEALEMSSRFDRLPSGAVPDDSFGLVFVRMMAQLFGGDLSFSRSEDSGLRAVISLPCSAYKKDVVVVRAPARDYESRPFLDPARMLLRKTFGPAASEPEDQ